MLPGPVTAAITHPVQGLDVELLLALERDKAHGWPGGGFGLGVPVVVLLHRHAGAHIFRRYQPNLMPQSCQRPPHVMGAATRFHRHHTGR